MVLTIEEKRARDRLYSKKYRDNNKEKRKMSCKQYYDNNKEKIKEYYKVNEEKIKERKKIYSKKYNQTPNRKKTRTIGNWKFRGLQHEDMSALYEQYLNATNCEECDIEFGVFGDGSGTYRCMDHNHETNLFRNFICHNCNLKRG